MGGDEFCVLAPLGIDGRRRSSRRRRSRALRGGRGLHDHRHPRAVVSHRDARKRRRLCARSTSACTPARAQAGRPRAGRPPMRCSRPCRSARRARHPPARRDNLCQAVADMLEVPDEDVAPLLQAAALHDVGKVGIPDAISTSRRRSTRPSGSSCAPTLDRRADPERAAPALEKAAKIVRSTHERYDGAGYPDGLAGEKIPLGSRIVAVCDAYDAMISDRPYRTAMSREVSHLRASTQRGNAVRPRGRGRLRARDEPGGAAGCPLQRAVDAPRARRLGYDLRRQSRAAVGLLRWRRLSGEGGIRTRDGA